MNDESSATGFWSAVGTLFSAFTRYTYVPTGVCLLAFLLILAFLKNIPDEGKIYLVASTMLLCVLFGVVGWLHSLWYYQNTWPNERALSYRLTAWQKWLLALCYLGMAGLDIWYLLLRHVL